NVIGLYGDERMIEVPAGFGRRLERRLAQTARANRRPWSTWSAWLLPVAALALITGGLKIASSLTNPHPMQSEHAQPPRGIPPDLRGWVWGEAKTFTRPGWVLIQNRNKVRRRPARKGVQEEYPPCPRGLRRYVETQRVQKANGDPKFAPAGDVAEYKHE